jgi:hypothetical protein
MFRKLNTVEVAKYLKLKKSKKLVERLGDVDDLRVKYVHQGNMVLAVVYNPTSTRIKERFGMSKYNPNDEANGFSFNPNVGEIIAFKRAICKQC